MPSSETLQICERPDSRSTRASLIRQWLVKFGAVYGRELTPLLIASWEEALGHIGDDGLLVKAFLRAEQTCRRFPMPADVLGQIQQADALGLELEAAEAWQQFLGWLDGWYHPDLGVHRGAPELPAGTAYAARAAGGFRWVATCPEQELQWGRKRFIEAYRRVHETRQVEHLLGDGEAKRILGRLAAGAKNCTRRALQGQTDEEAPSDADRRAGRSEFLVAMRKIIERPPATAQPLSEEEFERRKAEQRGRLARYLQEHPQASSQSGAVPRSVPVTATVCDGTEEK